MGSACVSWARLGQSNEDSFDFKHLKVFFGGATHGAGPGGGDIVPVGTRLNTLGGQTFSLVINETANYAHDFTIGGYRHIQHTAPMEDMDSYRPGKPMTARPLSYTASQSAIAGLYAITDGSSVDLLDHAAAALRGGARMLQYRDKSHDARRRLAEASALIELCAKYHIPLIINDDITLAQTCGAAGVHLGQHDPDIAYARTVLGPNAIIGMSCYNDLDRGQAGVEQGADYLAFGSFFESASKPQARRAPLDLLPQAKTLGKPLVAIGGITPDNGHHLIAAGADCLAIIRGVFAAADIEAAAHRYAKLFPDFTDCKNE